MDAFVLSAVMKRRAFLLGVIAVVWLAVVLRGRGGGPVPLRRAVLAATNGSFYHWRLYMASGEVDHEGWCAQRRSRTLAFRRGRVVAEERRSPAGVYRTSTGFVPTNRVVGMEMGDDFLSHETARLSGPGAILRPLGEGRYEAGATVYSLDTTGRIIALDAAGERVAIDYPAAIDSAIFERP